MDLFDLWVKCSGCSMLGKGMEGRGVSKVSFDYPFKALEVWRCVLLGSSHLDNSVDDDDDDDVFLIPVGTTDRSREKEG